MRWGANDPRNLPTVAEIAEITGRCWACAHHSRLDVILNGMRIWGDIMDEVRTHERQSRIEVETDRVLRAQRIDERDRWHRRYQIRMEADRAFLRDLAERYPSWFGRDD